MDFSVLSLRRRWWLWLSLLLLLGIAAGRGQWAHIRAEITVGRWLAANAPADATLLASRPVRLVSGLVGVAAEPSRDEVVRLAQPDFVVTERRLADQLLTGQNWFLRDYDVVATVAMAQDGRSPLHIWQRQPLGDAPLLPLAVRVPGVVTWRGYQQWPERIQPGESVRVRLVGERLPGTNVALGWHTVLRLTSVVDERPLAEVLFDPSAEPVGGGRLVQTFALETPPDLKPGAYQLQVAFRFGGADPDLLLIENNDIQRVFNRLLLSPLVVPWRGELPEGTAVAADFGGQIWLRGAELEGEVVAGAMPTLTLYWEAERPPDFNYTVFIHLLDETGAWVAGRDSQPLGGGYPTRLWQPGELVRDEHLLVLPSELLPGRYQLTLGLYRLKTGERLPLMLAGVGQPDGVLRLQTVVVE